MRTQPPAPGQAIKARTTTATAQTVTIQVGSLDSETADGWLVWGYRINSRSQFRATYTPRLYAVPREW